MGLEYLLNKEISFLKFNREMIKRGFLTAAHCNINLVKKEEKIYYVHAKGFSVEVYFDIIQNNKFYENEIQFTLSITSIEKIDTVKIS